MKKTVKLLRGTVVFCLLVILTYNLWILGCRMILHEPLPKVFGYSHAVVLSGSMEPTFSPGDLLIFQEQDEYGTGDIIVFYQADALVTHRIVGQTEGGFVTRGDANDSDDQEVLDPSNIEGRMVYILPGIGDVFLFLRTPLGMLIVVIAGLLLAELPNISEAIKERKRRGRK